MTTTEIARRVGANTIDLADALGMLLRMGYNERAARLIIEAAKGEK